ncbi:AAA family ATPase [Lentisalinibacter orientalis]|uniref:AAA family ATPase n=1 Tax=Lentisalinibacter orientalis TaxID=2992241 RepID=UPI0038669C75
MARPQSLISGVLYSGTETVLFGPQGAAKTFLIIDWCLHLIHGRQWIGRKTRRARCLIVCGEGGGRLLADRIEAWLHYYGIETDKDVQANLRVTEHPMQMLLDDSFDELLTLIEAEEDPFDLIVIDTLAANLGPGDENSAADMAAFCAAIRQLRLATGAAVVVVHHTGHSDRTRPQGSNLLRRNPDVELRVDRCPHDEALFRLIGGGKLKCRHGAGCGEIPYRLINVRLNKQDDEGETITSCVVAQASEAPQVDRGQHVPRRIGKNQVAAIRILNSLISASHSENADGTYITMSTFRLAMTEAGIRKQAVTKVVNSFERHKWIALKAAGFEWKPPESIAKLGE